MHTKDITQFVSSYLQSNGWILFERPCAALAYKRYKSAVGPKEAQVYFSGKDDGYNRLLSGPKVILQDGEISKAEIYS